MPFISFRTALPRTTLPFLLAALCCCAAPQALAAAQAEKVIVDTDIGDDIDDAFAIGLLLQSPEFDILGFTTAWGDTRLRAQLLERLLRETGHAGIPVAVGLPTKSDTAFTQAAYARRGALPPAPAADGVAFLLQQIKAHPGQITLVALGPLGNIGAAIERDPATFRQLRRVVMMGGSIRAGYQKSEYVAARPADREYNIVGDIPAARALFNSGVPIVMMPLDSTQLHLEEVERNAVFGHGSALADALTLLYHQWTDAYQPWASATPTLFDAVPIAWLIDQRVCPTTPMRIAVSDAGDTREVAGASNAEVCLRDDKARFIELLMGRLMR